LPDTLVIAKTPEQLLAEPEKAQRWQAVIFENNSFRLVVKEPSNSAAYRLLAAKVFRSKERL
jgi:hypothetical protein